MKDKKQLAALAFLGLSSALGGLNAEEELKNGSRNLIAKLDSSDFKVFRRNLRGSERKAFDSLKGVESRIKALAIYMSEQACAGSNVCKGFGQGGQNSCKGQGKCSMNSKEVFKILSAKSLNDIEAAHDQLPSSKQAK